MNKRGYVFPAWFGELVIILVVVGFVLVFVGFQAGPRLVGVTQNDIIGRLLGAATPEILAKGSVGNTANDVCFKGVFDIPLQEDQIGVTCISKTSCRKVFETTGTKTNGAELALQPDALYVGLGRQMCKYSLSGKEWCTGILDKNFIAADIAANKDYTCGTFNKIKIVNGGQTDESGKDRGVCVRNSDGKIVLETKDITLTSKPIALVGNSFYIFTKNGADKLIVHTLDKNKIKKGSKGSIVGQNIYEYAPAKANDRYLCYNTAEKVIQCTSKDRTLQPISADGKLVIRDILEDDMIYTQVSNGKWQINIKNLADGKTTNIAEVNFDPNSISQSSKQVCVKKSNEKYICIDKTSKKQIDLLGQTVRDTNGVAVNGNTVFPSFVNTIYSIDLEKVSGTTLNVAEKSDAVACKQTVIGIRDLQTIDSTQAITQTSFFEDSEPQTSDEGGVLPVG